MKNIIFIADFFVEHILGGGELNNEEVINIFQEKGYSIKKIQSHLVDLKFLENNKDKVFIVSNFVNLSFECRTKLRQLEYLIYEHDHKYLKSRNPATYDNFKAPAKDIVNFHFYKSAKAVLCQSKFHKTIIEKNLDISNVINLSGNLWSLEVLEYLRELSKREKADKYSILHSNIPHKNTIGSLRYCEMQGLQYELVSSADYKHFLSLLGANKKFIFLPQTPETLSRVVVEARMAGASVVTNNLVGATSEDWFKLKGEELIDYIINKRQEIVTVIENIINKPFKPSNKPLVSIITTFYKADKYLENFMKNITEQTIFKDCELVVIDAASPGKEQEIVTKYCDKYDNIVYKRLEQKLLPTPSFNMAIQYASSDLLTFAFTDDIKKKDCVEILYNELKQDNVSLTYGDVLVTQKDNETFEDNSSNGQLSEHSTFKFSKENMIKCLPGPMPLWNVEIHEQCGFFDDKDCNYADDWEMWLRAVDSGHEFKKVDDVVGLVLAGGRSQQNNIEQRKEEAKIFYKYSHLFGQNYHNFNSYFRQFLEK
jgi:glycosyltransferase involved in cell wall biosynthesis